MLLRLLPLIVAGLTQRLQVLLVPEEQLVTAMGFDVVAYELGAIDDDAAASLHLASQRVAREDLKPQPAPSRGPVPFTPRLMHS
jgi:hypothetical protein